VVKITDIQITSAAGSYIADAKGYFRDEGIEAQFLPMPSGDQVPAILSGTADVAGTAINAALYNALARGLPLKLVADHGSNLEHASAGGWVIRKDLVDGGQYQGPADARGYRVAVGTPSSTADISLDRFLRTGGLTIADVEIVLMNFPDMIAAFASKAIDAAYYQEPFTTIALGQGLIVRGPIGYEIYPNQQIAALTFGATLTADPDLSRRYLRAYTRGVRDYVKGFVEQDPAMFDEVSAILIEHTTVKDPALLRGAIPSGLKPDPVLNEQSIVDDLEWFLANGKVSERFDVRAYIDSALVQEAIRQVGPVTAG